MALVNSNGIPLWLPGANGALCEGGLTAQVTSAKLTVNGGLVLTLNSGQTITVQDAGVQALTAVNAQLTASWTAATETDRRNKHK